MRKKRRLPTPDPEPARAAEPARALQTVLAGRGCAEECTVLACAAECTRRSERLAALPPADADQMQADAMAACDFMQAAQKLCDENTCPLGNACPNRVRPEVVEIKPCLANPWKGHGLFAREHIPPGAPVAAFGPTIQIASDRVEAEKERLGWVLTWYGKSYKLRNTGASATYKAMKANHQCQGAKKANVELEADVDENGNFSFYLRATRDIQPGEEIVYCYSDNPGFKPCVCDNCVEPGWAEQKLLRQQRQRKLLRHASTTVSLPEKDHQTLWP